MQETDKLQLQAVQLDFDSMIPALALLDPIVSRCYRYYTLGMIPKEQALLMMLSLVHQENVILRDDLRKYMNLHHMYSTPVAAPEPM